MALDQQALDSLKIERNPQQFSTNTAGGKGKWWLAVVLLLVAGGLWWWLRSPTVTVQVAEVQSSRAGSTNTVLDASGYVVARRQATVSAKVTGKVMEVMVEEGMHVKADQVLAKLDPSTTMRQLELTQQQLLAAKADLAQVQVKLDEAQRAAKRAEQLRTDKMISEADLDAAQSTAAAYQAQLNALQTQVNVANASVRVEQQAMNDLVVRAPFAGVVISKDAQPGEMVSPISAGGGYTRTGIATLVDMDSREIEVDVNEAFINRVSDGQTAEAILDAYPDWTIPCHVISIVPAADRQKATVKVRIGFDQLEPRILPDMGVKVRFLDNAAPTSAARVVLQVPADAVANVDGKQYVWRVTDNHAQRLAVSTGETRSGQVEIMSGLSAGDLVIRNADPALPDNAKVSIQP